MRLLTAFTVALTSATGCVAQDNSSAPDQDTTPVVTKAIASLPDWTAATTYKIGDTLPAWPSGGQHMYLFTVRNDTASGIHGIYEWIMVDGNLLNNGQPLWVASGGGIIANFDSQVNSQYYAHVYGSGNDGLSIHSTGASPLPGHPGGPGGWPGGFHFNANYLQAVLDLGTNELNSYNNITKNFGAMWGEETN